MLWLDRDVDADGCARAWPGIRMLMSGNYGGTVTARIEK